MKLLELAWQLVADHSLFLEGAKFGSWKEAILAGMETCQRLHPSLIRENAAIIASEAAFQEYAKGYVLKSPSNFERLTRNIAAPKI